MLLYTLAVTSTQGHQELIAIRLCLQVVSLLIRSLRQWQQISVSPKDAFWLHWWAICCARPAKHLHGRHRMHASRNISACRQTWPGHGCSARPRERHQDWVRAGLNLEQSHPEVLALLFTVTSGGMSSGINKVGYTTPHVRFECNPTGIRFAPRILKKQDRLGHLFIHSFDDRKLDPIHAIELYLK